MLLHYLWTQETAEWIKIPLGTEVGLGSGDIVLDGAQHPQKGHAPIFDECLLWPNGRPSQLLWDLVLK